MTLKSTLDTLSKRFAADVIEAVEAQTSTTSIPSGSFTDELIAVVTNAVASRTGGGRRAKARTATLPMRLDELEWLAIDAALEHFNNNRTRAAAALGINRVTLYKKLLARKPAEKRKRR